MSSKAARIKEKTQFRFPLKMYTELYGTLFIICHMFAEEKQPINQIVKKWKKSEITIMDKDWVKKTEEYLGYKVPLDVLGFVQSDFNALFCILDGADNILPLREDGWMPLTYRKGKYCRIEDIDGSQTEDTGTGRD